MDFLRRLTGTTARSGWLFDEFRKAVDFGKVIVKMMMMSRQKRGRLQKHSRIIGEHREKRRGRRRLPKTTEGGRWQQIRVAREGKLLRIIIVPIRNHRRIRRYFFLFSVTAIRHPYRLSDSKRLQTNPHRKRKARLDQSIAPPKFHNWILATPDFLSPNTHTHAYIHRAQYKQVRSFPPRREALRKPTPKNKQTNKQAHTQQQTYLPHQHSHG